MGYGIEHTATLPTVGVTPRSTWAELLVDAIDEVRTTLDAKVTPAGLDINDDLSLRSGATFSGLVDVAYVSLHLQASLLAADDYPGVVYKGPDGELYYNDDANNQVQLSSGGSVAAAAGNISGTGYGSSGVEIAWVTADSAYEFRSGAGADDFADGKFDDVYLNDGSGNNLRLAAPSMGSDYSLTFPAAVPASTSLLTMDSGGALAVTRDPSIDTLTATTITASGLISANAGLTAAVDTNITVSGTGKLKHGSRSLNVGPLLGNGSGFTIDEDEVVFSSAAGEIVVPIPLVVGWTVTDVSVYWEPAGTGSKFMGLYSRAENGTRTAHATRTFTSSSESDYAITGVGSVTVADGSSYYVLVGAGDTSDRIRLIRVTYEQQ